MQQNIFANSFLITTKKNLILKTQGKSRILRIINLSEEIATNVVYEFVSRLPAGTSITPKNCGNLPHLAICTLKITPGIETSIEPIQIRIFGENTNELMIYLNIINYGAIFQGGYVFAINDNPPENQNIQGKVVSLFDEKNIIWSSNGINAEQKNTSWNDIPGITSDSIYPEDFCTGNLDGACNTNMIANYYSPPQTKAKIDFNYYAAGLCKLPINGFNDWYLPAICELGYDVSGGETNCGTDLRPKLENIATNLVNKGLGNLTGAYWSSTETKDDPIHQVWMQYLQPNANQQNSADKASLFRVRCVRMF